MVNQKLSIGYIPVSTFGVWSLYCVPASRDSSSVKAGLANLT